MPWPPWDSPGSKGGSYTWPGGLCGHLGTSPPPRTAALGVSGSAGVHPDLFLILVEAANVVRVQV